MQIDYSPLSSRVARRVFALFILCALLPVGALSLVAFTDVTDQLTQQVEKRVRQESKVVGMAVYQRLLFLESEFLSLTTHERQSASSGSFGSLQEAMPNIPLFLTLAQVPKGGVAQEPFGGRGELPSLTPAQWALLHDKKTLLVTAAQTGGPRRVFLARLLGSRLSEEQAVFAEINGDYLWGTVREVALPTDLAMCVFGDAAEILFCTESPTGRLMGQWVKQKQVDRPSVFEWHDGQDSYIAGYWSIPLRYEFSVPPWTVVLSEPRAAVLAPLATFKTRFSLIVLVAVLCVTLLSVGQIRKTMVPLERLGEGTRRIARRDFSTPVRVHSGDEFEELAKSFNAMAVRLNRQFSQLATIHEIDRSVLSVLDPSRIVDTVLARVREVFPCEAIAVLLLDPSAATQGWFYTRLGKDCTDTAMEAVTLGDEDGPFLKDLEEPWVIPSSAVSGVLAKLAVPEAGALVLLPLRRANERLGAIALAYLRTPVLHEERRLQLRQLADLVAVALSNASDLGERKRAETSLRESNVKLEAALNELQAAQQQMVQQERLRALGQMASGIAHDFNNTLSPIVGFSELLLIDPNLSKNDAQLKEYLQTINLAAKDAAKVVSRLRDFYRPRVDADLAGIVDLNRLVEQTVKLSQPKWKDQALANGIAIEMHVEVDAVPPVAGHESELREVLTNLVFNAVDAMPKSGSITIRTKVDGDHVRVEVTDTGTGMTDEVRRRCLEPFFSTKGEKGSGLGLAMVYGIIRRLRGTIDITSSVGQGTTFSLRLPIQSDLSAARQSEGQSLDGRKLQVLVVDDDPLVGRVTSEYLRVAGHDAQLVGSAAEAITQFHPDRVHLVVTDHGMPHMTGRQLAKVIKKVSPQTPVLLLTGGDETEGEDHPSDAVDAALTKPVTMASLRKALSRMVIPSASSDGSRKEIGEAA